MAFPQFSETGTWTVTHLSVQDAVGHETDYGATTLAQLGFPTELVVTGQAEDVTPPMIAITTIPKTLWPPNGKLVPVTVSGTITDAGSGVVLDTATYEVKDEYGQVQPMGSVDLKADGSYSFTIDLEASRRGNDADGRYYTITVSALDTEGNEGSAAAIVTVPHAQGQGRSIAAR